MAIKSDIINVECIYANSTEFRLWVVFSDNQWEVVGWENLDPPLQRVLTRLILDCTPIWIWVQNISN